MRILVPGTFQAEIVEAQGKAVGANLSYRLNPWDKNPKVVKLAVKQPLKGFARLPFTYQYVEPTNDRPWAWIIIVVGPGVSIKLENYPNEYIASDTYPAVDILRVQDPDLIPPMASDLSSMDFQANYEVNPMPRVFVGLEPPENYFQITQLPTETVIKHMFSNTEVRITVPQISQSGSGEDAQARFAYYFDPEGKLGSVDRPLLTILKTPAVKIEIADHIFVDSLRASQRLQSVPLRLWFMQVFEINDINAIPSQGTPITPQKGWTEIRSFDRIEPLEETAAKAAFDVAVGFIPFVGNAVNLAEFVYGVSTGHDKWGRKLTGGDLVLLGIGALLPFLAMARPASVIARFGSRFRNARALAAELKAAQLSSQEAALIREAAALIREGKVAAGEAYEAATKIVQRFEGETTAIGDILNGERNGFVHAELQEQYQAYKAKGKALGPEEWAKAQTVGRSRELLEGMLGKDYARKAATAVSQRLVNLMEIPRTVGMTEEATRQYLTRVLRNRKLFERLDPFLEQLQKAEGVERQLLLRKVSAGYYRILKGNLGEVLSRDLQLGILKDIAAREPSARIISGIKVRLFQNNKLGKELLFSDNIIAVQRGRDLHILGVMEVKAGYRGHAEATAQIFEWLEGRLDEGSQLIIPPGATAIAADGTESAVRAGAFTYAPGTKQAGQVKLLFSADRHLFVADGVSHVGMDSGLNVATNVHSHSLGVSSADIDWLTGQVLMSLSLQ